MLLFIILEFFAGCSSTKRDKNIIALYYSPKKFPYLYNEIRNRASKIVFRENLKLIFRSVTDNIKDDISFIAKSGAFIVILEDDKLSRIKKLYNSFRKKKIKVALITSEITNTEYSDYLFTTDFSNIGRRTAEILYKSTRKRRNVFVMYLNKKKSRKQCELVKGISSFFKEDKDILFYTNYYTGPDKFDKEDFHKLVHSFSGNLRGIFVDNDEYGVLLAKELRMMKKDNKIKLASFGATIEGINSILKTEIAVSGDINRISLYTNALKILINVLKEKNINSKKIIYYDKGVCYTQVNIMDLLAKTKKYSIQEILTAARKLQ